MPRKNIESQQSPEDNPEEKVLGSENINDWEENEEGVLELKEEVKKAQLEEQKNPAKIEKLKKEVEGNFTKEEPEFEEKKEDAVEGAEEETGEETIEDRIQGANSLEGLVDILKPMKKGSGFQLYPKGPSGPRLNIGWFFGGKFGGEPVSSIISHIEEIKSVVDGFGPDHHEDISYVDQHHIGANMDYIPEKGGLRRKVGELLKRKEESDNKEREKRTKPEKLRQEKFNNEWKDRTPEYVKSYEVIIEQYKQLEGLFNKSTELLEEMWKVYQDISKWEYLMNMPEGKPDDPLVEFRPRISAAIDQLHAQAKESHEKLEGDLEVILKKIEDFGYKFFADDTRDHVRKMKKTSLDSNQSGEKRN